MVYMTLLRLTTDRVVYVAHVSLPVRPEKLDVATDIHRVCKVAPEGVASLEKPEALHAIHICQVTTDCGKVTTFGGWVRLGRLAWTARK